MTLSAHFINSPGGRLFITVRRPVNSPASPAVLVAPAFGDEMNKSRRMLTELGIRLNQAGVALINPDLLGTGDSDGDFRQATWSTWVENLGTVLDWADEQGLSVKGLIGVRTGMLLTAELGRVRPELEPSIAVFWQGVLRGDIFLRQYLRLRTMQRAFEGKPKESNEELRRRIADGETIYVGGYPLTDRVVEPLGRLELGGNICISSDHIVKIEVSRLNQTTHWNERSEEDRGGASVVVPGEPFWNATETVVNQEVLDITGKLLSDRLRT